jgi:hypothetical protein
MQKIGGAGEFVQANLHLKAFAHRTWGHVQLQAGKLAC